MARTTKAELKLRAMRIENAAANKAASLETKRIRAEGAVASQLDQSASLAQVDVADASSRSLFLKALPWVIGGVVLAVVVVAVKNRRK